MYVSAHECDSDKSATSLRACGCLPCFLLRIPVASIVGLECIENKASSTRFSITRWKYLVYIPSTAIPVMEIMK